jgi:transposase-like protein
LSLGNTLEFLLSPTRDAEAAKRFLLKTLGTSAPHADTAKAKMAQPILSANEITSRRAPRVINVDKNAAYPKAIAELKASGALSASVELRQVKYLNNMIEQDHRFIKRLVKPGMGFFSFTTAWRTFHGYEAMHMIRKGQVQGVNKGEMPSQATFIAELFGVAI